MLAALLCNLEEPRGQILRERGSASVGRDVLKATKEIEDILFPLPAKAKAMVKRAVQKVYEYQALPTVDTASLADAQQRTQDAIQSVQSFMEDMQEPQWMPEIRLVLERLTIMAMQLNDDEEALLLLLM